MLSMFSVQAGGLNTHKGHSEEADPSICSLWLLCVTEGSACGAERGSHLVLDEGHQRGDNHGDAFCDDSRQLVAQTLAACNGLAQHYLE